VGTLTAREAAMIRRTHAADLAGCGHYQRGSSAAMDEVEGILTAGSGHPAARHHRRAHARRTPSTYRRRSRVTVRAGKQRHRHLEKPEDRGLASGDNEKRSDALRYLWARRPAVAGGSVRHVQAVSSRVTPSPPSRRRAARSPAPTTPFTTVRDAQKAPLLLGKGPDLRKLVAGAGFEPATSGL
jgi:hypothetical protein